MPAKPRWLLAIPDAISQLERSSTGPCSPRRDIERLFSVGNGARRREDLRGQARRQPTDPAADEAPAAAQEAQRPGRVPRRGGETHGLVAELQQARLTGFRFKVPAEPMSAKLADLPEGVSVERGRIEVRFDRAENALARLYALAQALGNDLARFQALVGR